MAKLPEKYSMDELEWFVRAITEGRHPEYTGFDPTVKVPSVYGANAERISKITGPSAAKVSAGKAVASSAKRAGGKFTKKSAVEKLLGGTGKGKLGKLLKNPHVSGIGTGLLLAYLLGKGGDFFFAGPREEEMKMAELEAMANVASPEASYLQATLPYTLARERETAGALLGQIAGSGVLGPSLAQGEYSIGG